MDYDRAQRVLVLGGYGAFGARVVERLASVPGIGLVIAGRSLDRAREAARKFQTASGSVVTTRQVDAHAISPAEFGRIGAAVVINASGPYQSQDYTLARACIMAGAHYIDLADSSGFVTGIRTLDAEARDAGVLVVSGASTVPALSAAVADAFQPSFASLRAISTIIAPGNSFDPGLATTRSILLGLGRPIPGRSQPDGARGWQGLRRVRLPGLGARWIGHCDAPDRELFLQRYPTLKSADVYAALEVGVFHLGLWCLSGLVRARVLPKPEVLAGPLLAMKRRLSFLGSDRGGMLMILQGTNQNGAAKQIDWHLVAEHGHGPYIPATPAALLTKRLLDGTLRQRGAMPCLGLFTLDEFLKDVSDLEITAGSS